MAMARTRKGAGAEDPLPPWIEPQLALAAKAPPAGPGWAHEIKYDGYRLHARIAGGAARLLTRTGLDWTDRYPATAAALAALPLASAYIDGELCALRADGTSSFAELQAASDSRRTGHLIYIAFDLLYLDGRALARLPLGARKERLAALLAAAPPGLRYGEHLVVEGAEFFAAARRLGCEGVVSKRLEAPYAPGNRGLWRKAKCYQTDEFVIVGFSEPEGSRAYFGALLLGYYTEEGRLLYAGRAGAGFSDRELRRLYLKLKPLEIASMALSAPPPKETRFGSPLSLKRVHWVRPELVCAVRYMTWTADGLLRQVSYEGLREDKAASDVRRPAAREG